MSRFAQPDPPPEAMADVPGFCEVSLTRAVVRYGEGACRERRLLSGGDLGVAVVTDGRFASRVSALDLGSCRVRELDLSTELMVLDWVYPPTLEHLEELLALDPSGSGGRRYSLSLALRVLGRIPFGELTRPVLLRLAFRDVELDVDPHDGDGVRLLLAGGRVARVHLEPAHARLVVTTPSDAPAGILEEALASAFPESRIHRPGMEGPVAAVRYAVSFPTPATLQELFQREGWLREGVVRLVERFEPTRMAALTEQWRVFGVRRTLARLTPAPNVHRGECLPDPGLERVH